MTHIPVGLAAALLALAPLAAAAADGPKPVGVHDFVRAETDSYLAKYAGLGALGKFTHTREPVRIDQQDVIRMNRDTLYSAAVFDLASPVTITLPDGGGRFQSLLVIDQDHYVLAVEHGPGAHRFARTPDGTRYIIALVRTFMDPNDPADLDAAHRLQDAVAVDQASPGTFEVPDWNRDELDAIRGHLNALAASLSDFTRAFGARDEVNPIDHLIATAGGWGGNPAKAATYLGGTPAKNDGETPYALTVRDVPVDGFWSITVYGADGFMVPNALNAYSVNDVTAKKNADGAVTVHFGGCEDGRVNCLPTPAGWGYIVRLYQPRPEILDGSWTFPEAEPAG